LNDSAVYGGVAIVTALFAFGAAVIAIATQRISDRAAVREYWRYYVTELGIVGAVLVPLAIHPRVFTVVLVFAAARFAWEAHRLYAPSGQRHELIVCIVLAIVSVGVGNVAPAAWLLTGALIGFAGIGLSLATVRTWSWAISAAPLLCAAHLAHLAAHPRALQWLFLLFVTVEIQDAFAWLIGRRFGRRLLLPRISPRKTWAGAIGGAVAGVSAGMLVAHLMLGTGWQISSVLAVLLVVGGFAGDVAASLIKRVARAKDFQPVSRLHGGLIDIYDSTLFAAVVLTAILVVADPWR
jgi:phosphatidate cytidylyltransferase